MLQKIKRRLSRRFRRRTHTNLEDLAAVDRQVPMVKLGSRYGGWTVPQGTLGPHSRCYLFGAGEDISFDVALVRQFGCEVHVFDPTPRAKSHVAGLFEATRTGNSFPINNNPETCYDLETVDLKHLNFHDIGIWSSSSQIRFYAPANPEHVSHSAVNLQRTNQYFEAEVNTLGGIMKKLGQAIPDLVKLDIEGAEYQALESMLENSLFPAHLLVEFDEGLQPIDGGSIERICGIIGKLRAAGYWIADLDGWNACFIHTSSFATLQQGDGS